MVARDGTNACAALQPCVAAERKFKRKLLWRKYVRVYVINRRIIARRELYAAMLLPDFQADRRIKAMPVVTYKSSARRPAPLRARVYATRLNAGDVRNVS